MHGGLVTSFLEMEFLFSINVFCTHFRCDTGRKHSHTALQGYQRSGRFSGALLCPAGTDRTRMRSCCVGGTCRVGEYATDIGECFLDFFISN